jgi:hypothetical protein
MAPGMAVRVIWRTSGTAARAMTAAYSWLVTWWGTESVRTTPGINTITSCTK